MFKFNKNINFIFCACGAAGLNYHRLYIGPNVRNMVSSFYSEHDLVTGGTTTGHFYVEPDKTSWESSGTPVCLWDGYIILW